MGIEPTQDLLGPTLVLKTRGNTSHQSPPKRSFYHKAVVIQSQEALIAIITVCGTKSFYVEPATRERDRASAKVKWVLEPRGITGIIP